MIKNKKDLKEYLRADAARYGKSRIPFIIRWLMHDESTRMKWYLIILRYLEYYTNVNTFLNLGKIMRFLLEFIHRRQAFIYQVHVNPNTCGPGLRIVHIGSLIHLNCIYLGRNCTVTAGVVIGKNGDNEHRPIIGNNVSFTLGCKVIGKVVIGDNAIIAPNSVVVKDVPSNCVVSGIPAQIIKKNGKKISQTSGSRNQ